MSKISTQRFTNEEFIEQQSWIGKLFSPLNQFIEDVIGGFSNGMTVQDNLFQEMKDIKWVNSAANFPLGFTTKFKSAPKGLLPIYLFNNTTGSLSSLAPWITWSYADGQIKISDISGLTAGSTYTIRILVIYG